jgi:hypothetical protein
MYKRGAEYNNYIVNCVSDNDFCALKVFDYKIPDNIYNSLLNIGMNDENSKRVEIYNWKSGKTVATNKINQLDRNIIDWYIDFSKVISNIIGQDVKHTSLLFPTSCALLVYDKPGDFINWHFDQNHFKGRFFTVLLPITVEETDTKYTYIDPLGVRQHISQNDGNIVFEGSKVFHAATKLGPNQKRIVLSLQYVTDDTIDSYNSFLMMLKDFAYIGI